MLHILKNLRICFKIYRSFYQIRVEEGLSGGRRVPRRSLPSGSSIYRVVVEGSQPWLEGPLVELPEEHFAF